MTDNLLTQAEDFQNLLISLATGGGGDNECFVKLRKQLISSDVPKNLIPKFIFEQRDTNRFWHFISDKYNGSGCYKARREYLWGEFRPLLEFIENGKSVPSDSLVASVLHDFNPEHVKTIWEKALERRISDPDGAITIARTLIESVCKHILDEEKVIYNDSSDLQKLYKTTAEVLKLSPSLYDEQIFKQILGGCATVIEGLGALRNRQGDAHGKGKGRTKPAPRHAELAVNLSGALASYLVATWENRNLQE